MTSIIQTQIVCSSCYEDHLRHVIGKPCDLGLKAFIRQSKELRFHVLGSYVYFGHGDVQDTKILLNAQGELAFKVKVFGDLQEYCPHQLLAYRWLRRSDRVSTSDTQEDRIKVSIFSQLYVVGMRGHCWQSIAFFQGPNLVYGKRIKEYLRGYDIERIPGRGIVEGEMGSKHIIHGEGLEIRVQEIADYDIFGAPKSRSSEKERKGKPSSKGMKTDYESEEEEQSKIIKKAIKEGLLEEDREHPETDSEEDAKRQQWTEAVKSLDKQERRRYAGQRGGYVPERGVVTIGEIIACNFEGEGEWTKGYTKFEIKKILKESGTFQLEEGKFKGTQMRSALLMKHEGQRGFYRVAKNGAQVMFCEEEGKGKKHLQVRRDVKEEVETLRELIYAVSGERDHKAGEAISYDEVEEGDYLNVGVEMYILSFCDDNNPPKNRDPKCFYAEVPTPEKRREIYDVKMDYESYDLERHTPQDYLSLISSLEDDEHPVKVIASPMGTGKSTFFVLMYANQIDFDITIVCPNIQVAEGTFDSMRRSLHFMKESKVFSKYVDAIEDEHIGRCIDGEVIRRKISVITPGYLESSREGHITIFDQFQTIRHYNKAWIEREENLQNLILMSATPYVPLLGELETKGFVGEVFRLESKREVKRWFVFGKISPQPTVVPNGVVVFSTTKPDLTLERAPNYVGLRESVFQEEKHHYWVHPTKCYGWNPPENLKAGVISFNRPVCVPTGRDGILQLISGYQPSDEEVYQAAGRLSRNFNGMGFLLVNSIAQYCNLRFQQPKIQRNDTFANFFEAYQGMSTPVVVTEQLAPMLPGWIYKVVNGHLVFSEGDVRKISNAPSSKFTAAAGITITGATVTATYFYEKAPHAQEVGEFDLGKGILDLTTMGYTRDIKNSPPGVFKVFNVGIGVNNYFELAEKKNKRLNENNLAFMMSEYGMDTKKWPKRTFKGYDATFVLFVKVMFPNWKEINITSAYIPKKTEGIHFVADRAHPLIGLHGIVGSSVTFDTKKGHPFYIDDKKYCFSFSETLPGHAYPSQIRVSNHSEEIEQILWSGTHFDFANWQGEYELTEDLIKDLPRSGELKGLTEQAALKILSVGKEEYTQGWIPFAAEVPNADPAWFTKELLELTERLNSRGLKVSAHPRYNSTLTRSEKENNICYVCMLKSKLNVDGASKCGFFEYPVSADAIYSYDTQEFAEKILRKEIQSGTKIEEVQKKAKGAGKEDEPVCFVNGTIDIRRLDEAGWTLVDEVDFLLYCARAPKNTVMVNIKRGEFYVYERNSCRCAAIPDKDYSLIDYYLFDLGCDFCQRCIQEDDVTTIKSKRVFKTGILDYFKDIRRLFSGSVEKEQETVTYLASWLKVKIEKHRNRSEKEKFLRQVIHWSDKRALMLHRTFNDEFPDRPAIVIEAILSALKSFFGQILRNILNIVNAFSVSEMKFEDVVNNNAPVKPEQASKMSAQANLIQESRGEGLIYPVIKPVMMNACVPGKNTSCLVLNTPTPDKSQEAVHVKKKAMGESYVSLNSTGHISAGIARDNFTYDVLSNNKNKILVLGSSKFEGNNEVVMVSEDFGSTFKCPNPVNSRGIYCRIVLEEVEILLRTLENIGFKPTQIYVRDSIHDPKTLAAILEIYKRLTTCTSLEILTHVTLADISHAGSTSSGTYTTEKSTIRGWVRRTVSLGGEQIHGELAFTAAEIQRIAIANGMMLIPRVNFYSTNICYARLTFGKTAGCPYGDESDYMNHFGGLTYDTRTGKCHVQVSEQQVQVLSTMKHGLSRGHVLNRGYTENWTTEVIQTEVISSRKKRNIIARAVRSALYWKENREHADERSKDIFEREDRRTNWQILMDITKYKKSVWNAAKIILEDKRFVKYNEPIDVTHDHCTLKYVRARNIKKETNKVTREMIGLSAFETVAGKYHAIFENQDTQKAVVTLQVSELDAIIEGRKDSLKKLFPYEWKKFTVIRSCEHSDKPSTVGLAFSTSFQAPSSFHVVEKNWNEMLDQGYNSTVLGNFRFKLGDREYATGQMPSYQVVTHYCTCTVKKEQLLTVIDNTGEIRLDQMCMENCPVNLLYALVARQCGAKVNPDIKILEQFTVFVAAFNEYIVQQMQSDDFKILNTDDEKEAYLKHVKQTDPRKALEYRKNFEMEIDRDDRSKMFVKTGENHAVWVDEKLKKDNRTGIKPRFICCPSFTVRARIGLISYFTLKWFKRNFPEYLLGKSPEQVAQDFQDMTEKPFTYESDFSAYDSTNNFYIRKIVDNNLFRKMVQGGILHFRPTSPREDENHLANIEEKFELQSRGGLSGRGTLLGTTFSGHPTATTLMGTTRNFLYHYFNAFRLRHELGIPVDTVKQKEGNYLFERPRQFGEFLGKVRSIVKLRFAGDDTSGCFRFEHHRKIFSVGMKALCSEKQEHKVHGLGLVLKGTKWDYKRVGMLSRIICQREGKTFIVRQLQKLILTSTTCSPRLTHDEANYMSVLNLLSYSDDPLTMILAEYRREMIESYDLRYDKINQVFLEDRAHKMGGTMSLTTADLAYAYNMLESHLQELMATIRSDGKNLYMDLNLLRMEQQKLTRSAYGLGFGAFGFKRFVCERYSGVRGFLQGDGKIGESDTAEKAHQRKIWKRYTSYFYREKGIGKIAKDLHTLKKKLEVIQDRSACSSQRLVREGIERNPGPDNRRTHTKRGCRAQKMDGNEEDDEPPDSRENSSRAQSEHRISFKWTLKIKELQLTMQSGRPRAERERERYRSPPRNRKRYSERPQVNRDQKPKRKRDPVALADRKEKGKQLIEDAKAHKQKNLKEAKAYLQSRPDHLKVLVDYQKGPMKRRVESAAFQKVVREAMADLNCGREEAVASILYDDFFSDLFKKGKNAVAGFWQNNKHILKPLLLNGANALARGLIGSTQDKMKSQDPYAVSTNYLRALFSPYNQKIQMPRDLTYPLATFNKRIQADVVTDATGLATLFLHPSSCMYGTTSMITNSGLLPFMSMSKSEFMISANSQTAGPFLAQENNVTAYGLDKCSIAFVSTQSPLNCQGKVTTALYYQPPNATFQRNADGHYDPNILKLTAAEVVNSNNNVRVQPLTYFLGQSRHLIRWIPTSDDASNDLFAPMAPNLDSNGFIVAFFQGCAASTTIGTIYIDTAITVNPTANNIGVFPVSIRGSYNGTHLLLHQLRKNGKKPQYMDQKQAQQYIVPNFAELKIGSSPQGFCVDVVLRKLGLKTFGRPYITISQIEKTYPGLFNYTYGKSSELGPQIDLLQHHAYLNQKHIHDQQSKRGRTVAGKQIISANGMLYQITPFKQLNLTDPEVDNAFIGTEVVRNGGLYPDRLVTPDQILIISGGRSMYFDEKTQMTFDKRYFYIRSGDEYKTSEYMMKSKICFYLQGVNYQFKDQLELLKGGIQPNPGPKRLKKQPKLLKHEQTTKEYSKDFATKSTCVACLYAKAVRSSILNTTGEVSQLSEKCSDHAQQIDEH